jgi:hypothetical protein
MEEEEDKDNEGMVRRWFMVVLAIVMHACKRAGGGSPWACV